MILQTTDADGVWESTDGGSTWALVEPSQAFRDRQAASTAKPAAVTCTCMREPGR